MKYHELPVISGMETPDQAVSTSPEIGLRSIFLHVTKACNLHCNYCYFSASRPLPDELTTQEFTALWPQIVAIGPEKVVFTGGEPLLRSDLLELLAGMKAADPEHRVLRCLNTNGHLMTSTLARTLVGLADEVRVSIDALPERNDAMRGAGNFDAAIQALKILYAEGFEPKALITITAHTQPDLEELVTLLLGVGITRLNFNTFRPIGRGVGKWDWRMDEAVAQAAIRRGRQRAFPNLTPPPPQPVSEESSHCGVGTFLNVLPNGDVFPCHVLTNPEFRLGNLRNQSLSDICRREGLLGRLAELDFIEVSRTDPEMRNQGLSRTGTCLGNVYAKSPTAVTWKELLNGT